MDRQMDRSVLQILCLLCEGHANVPGQDGWQGASADGWGFPNTNPRNPRITLGEGVVDLCIWKSPL